MIKRLPINVRLFSENDEMVQSINSTIESRVLASLGLLPRQNWKYGVGQVWYKVRGNYWNKFYFTTIEQFHEIYLIDTDPAMLRDFIRDGIMDPRYLERRTVSDRQLAVLKRNQSKHTPPKRRVLA